jgi:DNA-directed RNA polymerase subunit RPC12/RpoP
MALEQRSPLTIPIERLLCVRCGTTMMLARLEREALDRERRTFECPKCEHSQSVVV